MNRDSVFFALLGCCVCGFLLGAAFCTLPFGLYTLLRVAVFAWGAFAVWRALQRWVLAAAFLPLCFALVFNPLVPFRFPRSSWEVLDFLAAAAVLLTEAAFLLCALRGGKSAP